MAAVSANRSKGWRRDTVSSPPFHEQFETTKLIKRRFCRGSCASNSPLRVPREFENPQTFFQIGLVGVLVPFYLTEATILLGAPFT
jgi:hypothetical protein